MNDYVLILFAYGLGATLLVCLFPIIRSLKISITLVALLLGILIYYLGVPVKWPEDFWHHKSVKTITELIVIISLVGVGLKIGLRYGMGYWKNPLRLIHTTMPIYLGLIFGASYFVAGLDGPSSLLLAAVCAPTDPVMASDLQLENPDETSGKNRGLRYMLTAEAGINDGVAFPFVYLAILWNDDTSLAAIDWLEWSGFYLIAKILIGAAVGSVLGLGYSYLLRMIDLKRFPDLLRGFMAVPLGLSAFAAAELLQGYGFLAAFFVGLCAQYHQHRTEKEHSKSAMVAFVEETETLTIIIWVLIFGGFICHGILLEVQYIEVLLALSFILFFRPISGFIALLGTRYSVKKRWAISFLGIKGIGSFFYLTYALNESAFKYGTELYSLVCWTVLCSIVLHGVTGPKIVHYLNETNPG